MYYEEVDHCRRGKAARWKVVYYPDTPVVHLADEDAKLAGVLCKAMQISTLHVESKLLYMRKHYGLMSLDFHMALLGFDDAIVRMEQTLKCLLRGEATSQSQALFASTWRVLIATVSAIQAAR